MKSCLWFCLVGKEIYKRDFSVLLKCTWSISMRTQHMSLAVWKYICHKDFDKKKEHNHSYLLTYISNKEKAFYFNIFNNTLKKATHTLELCNIFLCFSGRESNYLEKVGLHFYAKLMLIILPLIPHSYPTLANCYKQLRAKIHSS